MAKLRNFPVKLQSFGGLNLVLDPDMFVRLMQFLDFALGVRSKSGGGYTYSEVIKPLFATYLAGGSCVEDVQEFGRAELSARPREKAPSADTVLRTLKRLSVENGMVTSSKGNSYSFNRNARLNGALKGSSLMLGHIGRGESCTFDYDNQIVATERRLMPSCL